jgi:hypothetical protein
MIDPARISELMLEDVTWTDPDGTTQGREALNERAQKLLDRLQGFVFTAAGPLHVSGDLGCSPSIWACPSSRRRSAGST